MTFHTLVDHVLVRRMHVIPEPARISSVKSVVRGDKLKER